METNQNQDKNLNNLIKWKILHYKIVNKTYIKNEDCGDLLGPLTVNEIRLKKIDISARCISSTSRASYYTGTPTPELEFCWAAFRLASRINWTPIRIIISTFVISIFDLSNHLKRSKTFKKTSEVDPTSEVSVFTQI